VENKIQVAYANAITWSSATSTTNSFQLIPTLSNGAADNQIIGNSAKCVSGQLRLQVYLNRYDAVNNPLSTPVMVRMLIVKNLSTQAQASTVPNLVSFFKIGGGTSGPQYNLLDQGFMVNNVLFRVLHQKFFKLGAASATTAGLAGTGGYFDNSPMLKNITINYGKWIKKNLEFQDGGTLCQNDNLYCVLLACYANGTSTGIQPIQYTYVNTFKYEDA